MTVTQGSHPEDDVYSDVIVAVCDVGVHLLMRQSEICLGATTREKRDRTIVTAADLESERFLLAAIAKHAHQPYRVVSEEGGSISSFEETEDCSLWFVDPLDGTANYASGSSDYAVLVSEWRDDRPVFSVVHYPATKELGWVVNTTVSWEVSSASRAGNDTVTHLCYIRDELLKAHVVECIGGVCIEHEMESTRALFDLALGRITGAIIRICGHGVWDLAAVIHLVEGAGCFVCDERGADVILRDGALPLRFLVAAKTEAMGRILQKVLESHLNEER